MSYYFISLSVVSFLMFHSGKLVPPVTWRLWIRHYIVTLGAALIVSDDCRWASYSVTHPQYAMDHFYVPKGFAPDWLYFSIRVASMIVAMIIWCESAASAARKPRARTAFLWIWPFYVALSMVDYVLVVQSHGPMKDIGYFYVGGIAMIAFFGTVIYLHFRSASSDDLFTSQHFNSRSRPQN
jgi:hypothetical protein